MRRAVRERDAAHRDRSGRFSTQSLSRASPAMRQSDAPGAMARAKRIGRPYAGARAGQGAGRSATESALFVDRPQHRVRVFQDRDGLERQKLRPLRDPGGWMTAAG
jgi:hypothetical protein